MQAGEAMITAAVFDMDGLMFDTERLVYENWQNMMDERGYEYDLDFFKTTVGKRKNEVQRLYFDRFGDDFPYWELADLGKARYVERVKAEGIPIKKGLIELLTFLKERGIKTALATSTSRQTAEFNLQISDTAGFFDSLVCGNDVKNGKPHPEVFLTAAQRLGEKSENCVAYEDSINGIISAHSAGMTTVMVPDYIAPTEEIKPMIDFLCADLAQSIKKIEPLLAAE